MISRTRPLFTDHTLLIICFGVVFPSIVFSSCAVGLTFPEKEGRAIPTKAELEALSSDPEQFRSERVRLAGRIVRAERTEKGIVILAQWLPYPKDDDSLGGPTDPAEPRYYLQYSGSIDDDGLQQGNEFLLLATLSGTKHMVPLIGSPRDVPLFNARCIRVWKTGGEDLAGFTSMDPLDHRYPPQLAQTYCSAK